MIVRVWLGAGVLLSVVAWFLVVTLSPPPSQISATTALADYRAAGLIPAGATRMSAAVGHEVFELPPTDAEHLKQELAAGATMGDMPGMNMGQPAGQETPAPMKMEQMAGDHAEQPAAAMPGMEMKEMPAPLKMDVTAEAAGQDAPSSAPMKMAMDEEKDEHDAEPDQHGAEGGMEMGAMGAADDDGGEEMAGGHGGGGGIALVRDGHGMKVSRELEITMEEWGFSPANVTVKAGETIRLVVTNRGNMPHEFMLMTAPGMGAVRYRLERADWNLTEHEAIYERPLVMPGERFETVIHIQQAGAWMYMCMFPYHMQFGMMGMMTSEGMAGMDMGGMKM